MVHGQQSEPADQAPGGDQSMEMKTAFTEYGVLVNSGEWSGKLSPDAMREMAEYAAGKEFWRAGRDLSHSRLGHFAAAILGRADSGRLLR